MTILDGSIIGRARAHNGRIAIVDSAGAYEYDALLAASERVASYLQAAYQDAARADLHESRIAFLVEPSMRWAAVQWGIWRAGGVAVPLATSHPERELAHVIADSGAEQLVADTALMERVAGIGRASGKPLLAAESLLNTQGISAHLPDVEDHRRALILYTSGTTSRPKGAVLTHANIAAQVAALIDAWEWSAHDRILGVLPLHHVHGMVNVLLCALASNATCVLRPRFDPQETWAEIARGQLTLFMAVPTIYARLAAAWESGTEDERHTYTAGCSRMRLMVSGSAALPVALFQKWQRISGHTLLERYGMTEIGMALSNPLHGERRPGFVGAPLPHVQVRLVDEHANEVAPGLPGEIEVRGPGVFLEYWNQPDATHKAFRAGWFRTGDVAVFENGAYRILGRKHGDILKVGGYKISALEIEEALREHPDVLECAVVGVPDDEMGERPCAAVVARAGRVLDGEAMRLWLRERIAPYKVPARVTAVAELPRNAMGKVTKTEVARWFLA